MPGSKIFHPRESRSVSLDRRSARRIVCIDERRDISGTMANDTIDTIYKSLRLLPEFDGNPYILTRFLKLCDQLVVKHFRVEPGHELANLALINGILNRITGPAARLINSSGIPENWSGIRSALINNFADHRDETALYNDLSLQTQGSSSPQEFYERCQSLFSTIMTYVSLHETVETTVEAKRKLYQKLTLQCYLRGLKDPLGSRVRCMRPESMEKALEFVQDELNTLYLQQRNAGGPTKSDWQPRSFNLPLNNFSMPKSFGNQSFHMPRQPNNLFNAPGTSRQFPPTQAFSGWRPNQQPPFHGPSRTQQMFRAPPPNYRPQSNVFRLPARPQPQSSNLNNAPRPMSGVSHFATKPLPPTGHDWRKFGNPPPSNYFKTREVNFNDFDYAYDPSDYEHGYPEDYYSTEYFDYEYQPDYYPYNNYEQSHNYVERATVEEITKDTNPDNNENFQTGPNSEKPK